MEYHRDVIGERLYASRNYNNLRQTFEAPGTNRGNLDWALTLRQVRKSAPLPTSTSMPNLSEGSERQREPLAPEHQDGPYHGEGETVGRYQNLGNSAHMLRGSQARLSSGKAHSMDWQLNLRDGLHRSEFQGTRWRRHYARPQQSFDMMAENCNADNTDYQRCEVTPQDRRPDRRSGAISCATNRDDPISFRRFPGCEGTQAGQWSHLIDDRRYGHKARRQIQHETTLREYPKDNNGARIQDSRSDGCLVEMMGKKKWQAASHHEPLAQRLPHGDAKLYHLSNSRLLPEQDETSRALRMNKTVRTDANLPEGHQPKAGIHG